MNDIDELVRYFWEESLLPEETKALQAAEFNSPVISSTFLMSG